MGYGDLRFRLGRGVQGHDVVADASPYRLELNGRRLDAIPNSRGILADGDRVVMSLKPQIPGNVPPPAAARLEADDAGEESNQ